ncbi:hypothetical protein LAZ67_10001839 [Cordylochernes scorpioides]|uniref:Mos1 transposase HTH domain-containing protein n=1 Tax=Cordylochernes scorpioides TaxID=51811 RepID=A0ABY6KW57_9ARAC|nr:hypothetical protein LAZ67_10001839 [Cordylochernes scorpioides]
MLEVTSRFENGISRRQKSTFSTSASLFIVGQKAAEAARDICNVYGKGVIGKRAAQKWFAKFKNCDLDLEDALEADDHQNSMRNI